jgi:hypothetical protein
MTRVLAPAVLSAALAATTLLPAWAQEGAPPADPPGAGADGDISEGFSLLEEGARIILRSLIDEMEPALEDMQEGLTAVLKEWEPALRELLAKAGDLSNYAPPEMLPNGDIIIRRKAPLPREPAPGLPDGTPDGAPDAGGGSVDL